MGYLYSKAGHMICDFCGAPSAKKSPCPFGYCPPVAVCRDCKAKHADKLRAAYHRAHGCETASRKYAAEQAAAAADLAAGEFMLCSALSAPGGMVHALFRNAQDVTIGRLIPADIYAQRSGRISTRAFEALTGRPLAEAAPSFY